MRLVVVALLVAVFSGSQQVLATDSVPDGAPPIVAAGADVVDIRNTTGGLTRYTRIPGGSIFASKSRNRSCSFVAKSDGVTYDGQGYGAGQSVSSSRWLFIEAKFQRRINAPYPATGSSLGAISTVGRVFNVYCDTADHHIDTIVVYATDPMLDPHPRITNLYNALQLVRPTVFRNPVVDRWGGLITRYPAWLAIQPAAWTLQRSNADSYRGWTLYLYTEPVGLAFHVVFTPDPEQPSPAFNGIVDCVQRGDTSGSDGVAFPAFPILPDESTPGANGDCMWTPPGPGTVTIEARITYRVTFWANGYTEELPDYTWASGVTTFNTGELSAVNTND